MGKLTEDAHEVLHVFTERDQIAPDAMSAAVAVKQAGGHIEFFNVDTFTFQGAYHVEQRLMQALNAKYGQIKLIPEGATVVFVARWSPCKYCTESVIPGFLRDADIVKRRIRVKFRFENYYAADTYPRADKVSDKNLWPSSAAAIAAYRELCRNYGNYDSRVTGVDDQAGTFTTKAKPFVVLAPTQVQKTSSVDTWFISDLI